MFFKATFLYLFCLTIFLLHHLPQYPRPSWCPWRWITKQIILLNKSMNTQYHQINTCLTKNFWMQITSKLKHTHSPTPINVHTRAARYQQNMQYGIMLLNTEMTIWVTIVKQMLHYTRSVFVWFRFKLQQTSFHHCLPSCQRILDWTILLLTWFEISGFALVNTSFF